MNIKSIAILAAITAPVTAAAILWPAPGGSTTAAQAGGPLLPALKSGFTRVTAMTFAGPGGTTKITHAATTGKPEEGWVVTDKFDYPIPPATIRPILEGLRALHGVAPKTERAKLYSRLDLDPPGNGSGAHGVTLTDAKGTTIAAVILGRQKPGTLPGSAEQQYARTPDNPRAWLAEPAITLPDSSLGFIDHSVVNIADDQIRRVLITQTGGETLELKRDKPADKLAVQAIPAGRKLKEEDPGTVIAGGLAALELNDVIPAKSLTNPPAATAHYETFAGLVADLTLTKQAGQSWATVTATGTGAAAKDAADITARTKGWAYALPDLRAATLQNTLSGLLEAPPAPAAKAAKATK